MSDDSSLVLQRLIDQFPDQASNARDQLLERTIDRVRRLAAKMLGESFPNLVPFHDVDSVVHEVWIRLRQALEQAEPKTVREFFGLAAHKIRHVLLDMVERGRRSPSIQLPSSADQIDPSQRTFDPAQLAIWAEFHQRVASLAEEERQVFEMHYYLDVPQSQIAELMELPPRQVSRLWIKATDRLTEGLAIPDGVP